MKKLISAFALTVASGFAFAAATVDAPAPDFQVKDVNGKVRKLADFKGKPVVLEWYNKDCPYVRKHYDSKNMQKIQADLTKKGVAWLTVVSSLPGKQGHQTATDAKANFVGKENATAATLLLDEDATMGKAYGAKTTPHMYVIDEQGVVRYQGAIDSNDSADPKTIATSENYVVAATTALLKHEPVKTKTTKPYGCGVKF